MHTPKFGQHVDNPDTPGECFCHTVSHVRVRMFV
jgi:hypothetical protein